MCMQGTTATYNINNLCSGIAQGTGYFDPGSIHTANMTGLTPVTRYYYIYGSDVSHLALPHPLRSCSMAVQNNPVHARSLSAAEYILTPCTGSLSWRDSFIDVAGKRHAVLSLEWRCAGLRLQP